MPFPALPRRSVRGDLDALRSYFGDGDGGGLSEVKEGPGIDVVGGDTVGLGLEFPLLLPGDGATPAAEYATLALALAAASAGDTVWLPPGEYDGDHTVGANVTVVGLGREDVILTGQITLSEGSVLENLSIIREADDASDLYGAATYGGIGGLLGVKIRVTQDGAGNAYGLYTDSGGVVTALNCDIHAEAAAGDGFGVYRDFAGGSIYVDGGICTGSTDPANE
jgi:hypothetical protein